VITHRFIGKTEAERRQNATRIIVELEQKVQKQKEEELKYHLTKAV
jgi:hypothetical protein